MTATLLLFAVCTAAAEPPTQAVYLSDQQSRFISATQAWGNLGTDTAVRGPGQQPQPLRIGQRSYAKGLGHHAAGEIVVSLEGEFLRFEADLGLQALPDCPGSVVFKVIVDDVEKFDSGVMRSSDPARPVSVELTGAEEMKLVVTDAGDGITCDCANWANARLIRDPSAKPRPLQLDLDVAPFARLVTSDPDRLDGSRANRIQEYRTDDLFLEDDIEVQADGSFKIPSNGVVGLRWLEPRPIRQIGIEFADADAAGQPQVQLQCWVGESAWQGGWVTAAGEPGVASKDRWTMRLNWGEVPQLRQGTRRVRWVFPKSAAGQAIKRLHAWSPTKVATAEFVLLAEKPDTGKAAAVEIYNGEIVEPDGQGPYAALKWNLAEPLRLKLRYAKTSTWKGDRTALRLKVPGGAFSIAIDDILRDGAVYVRDLGVFASTPELTLEQYKDRISERKTVLERVRSVPDQTLEQAMNAVHNPKQNLRPTMLSLACDNRKFIAHREGLVQKLLDPLKPNQAVAAQMAPRFGAGTSTEITRHLEGRWLPIPVVTVRDGGLIYRERSLVATLETEPAAKLFDWVRQHPLCVTQFEIENPQPAAAEASLALTFHAEAPKDLAEVQLSEGGAIAYRHGKLLAAVHVPGANGTKIDVNDGTVTLKIPLNTGAKATVDVFMPGWDLPADRHAEIRIQRDWRAQVRDHWEQALAPAAHIDVPDPLIRDLILASQVHCMLAARNEEEGRRIAAWIASVSYGPLESEAHSIIRGMDSLGHGEFSRRSLDFFVHRYDASGMLTTGYTLMGTGWHLWTLGEHYDRWRNAEWLKGVASRVAKVCEWVARQRQKTMKTRPDGTKLPEYGLMPPGVMADWNAFAYYFCLNGYYCAGLRDAGRALADIGFPEAGAFVKQAEDMRAEMGRAWRWTQARMPAYVLQDGTAVPGYPSQVHGPGPTADFFPGQDANRSWCYDVELGSHHLVPFGLLDPASPDVRWMMDHMEDVQFLAEGWFDYSAERNHEDWYNLGGFAKVQPYYCRNGEINAMRDDVRPFVRTYFNTLCSLLNRENLSFQEHFAGVAAFNKTHETGYFLHQTKLMLVMEHGDELWLAPFVTSSWMKDGMQVAVKNAPTFFGPVSYRVTSAVSRGAIEAEVEPPTRSAPKQIVIRLRHPEGKPMKSVTVNGETHKDFDATREIVRIQAPTGRLSVRARYD